MKNYFSHITELQLIRQQMRELTSREALLLAPLLNNQDDLPLVYDIFRQVSLRLLPDVPIDTPVQREKFIFIALVVFAPCTLLGDMFPHRLRGRLAALFDIHPTLISHTFESVIFQYQKVSAYKQELDYLYTEIEKELISRGKL